ncbi:hypothetical protein INR49_031903 [Caranx melampygus]|nr:hypothetical protein INR49_031903 [Caranx melampygus]
MATIGDFDPLNSTVPATKIEVTVSCSCGVVRSRPGHKGVEREVIDNTLNPDFVRKFVLDFFFEEKQNLRFDVYNVDTRSSNLSKHDIATMQFCANKLDKKDFFGKSDPFLVFYRSNEDGTFTICHKTEVIKNNLNPVWKSVKVDVYDWDRDGSHDFIGEFTTSYRELSRGQSQFNVYEVLNPKKKGKKKKYVNSGTVTLLSFKAESEFTPYQMNAYAMALKAVGEIIQDYDSDKLFPAYGFGAKLPPDGKISHAFPLNSNTENPNCTGIEEVTDGSQYFVLLMITDGVISDMAQTKEAVVNAASLPMSIVIVGVGPAEFDAMEELDGDEFVPFRDYIDRSGNQVLSMARLAKDVLAEIPDQLLSFMKSRAIEPRPPLSAISDKPSVSNTTATTTKECKKQA